jgi:hypothetical protein
MTQSPEEAVLSGNSRLPVFLTRMEDALKSSALEESMRVS